MSNRCIAKIVLNKMEAIYAGSTIRQAYIAMGTMFRAAVMNNMLIKHPMDGVRFSKPVRAVDDIKFLTVEEQAETAKAISQLQAVCTAVGDRAADFGNDRVDLGFY